MQRPEVAIVGAGPVGLLTALGLARAGVRVCVLDAAEEPNAAPRALVYHWAVMEGLARLGVLEDFVAAGVVKHDYSMKVFQTGETIRWSIRALEGLVRHPYNVHLGQHELSAIVLSHLSRLPNAEVRWGTRITSIAQDGRGVRLGAESGGQAVQLDVPWVVAADGARSTVRHALGLGFEGTTWPKGMVATNVRADLEALGFERSVFVIDQAYGAIIVKIDSSNLWRVTYCEQPGLPEDSIRARIPQMYANILPGLGSHFEVQQHSPYRMHQRAATRFRVGRVLLAGDAAHITNPVGGLGLTAGIFDAFLLHEALAAVVHGDQPESVLDRYADERRENFLAFTSPQATENYRLLFCSDDAQRLESDLVKVRRLQTDRDAVLDRTLYVAKLETPSLLTGARACA